MTLTSRIQTEIDRLRDEIRSLNEENKRLKDSISSIPALELDLQIARQGALQLACR